MKNKILLLIIIILIPLAVISFFNKETNFLTSQTKEKDSFVEKSTPIYVKLNQNGVLKNIELEEYLIGVVSAEMPASFQMEALKAQAVAARTYAYKKILNNLTLTGTTSDQAYITEEEMQKKWGKSFEQYYQKIKDAVQSTQNLIITYNNQPINAYYFSMSNGQTESALTVFQENSPYLVSVPSTWEQDNSGYIQTTEFTPKQICQLINQNCSTITYQTTYSDNSRLEKITINEVTYSGIEFRQLLQLRSTAIKISQNSSKVIITTEGYGHGVGMSQYGANGMAQDGKNYDEIIKYYYQGVEIQSINA